MALMKARVDGWMVEVKLYTVHNRDVVILLHQFLRFLVRNLMRPKLSALFFLTCNKLHWKECGGFVVVCVRTAFHNIRRMKVLFDVLYSPHTQTHTSTC